MGPCNAARTVPIAVGVLATVAGLAGIDARATDGARVSGDEPQYLLTATSLGEDLDLDIGDEIAERRFADYHEVDLDMQTLALDEAGRQVSPHDPLLPALLALPMRLGGWAAAKATLALVAGLTAAATAWVAIRRLGVTPVAAGVAVGAAFVGLSLAAYGGQVYPEMAAALATIVGIGALSAERVTRPHLVVGLVTVVALPWLAVKYVPVAAVVFAWLGWRWWPDRRRVAMIVALGALAGVAYLVAHRLWYGGWTVYATGDHFAASGEFSVVGTDVDLLGRSQRLTGLIVDQDFGLAAWAPVWFLAPFGLGALVASGWSWRWWAAAVVAVGWANATFVALTMHGFWVPGRQVVVVAPIFVLALAGVADRGATTRWILGGLGAVGALNWIWLAVESSTGRRTLIVDFTETAAWPYRAVRMILPNGLDPTSGDRVLLGAWSVVIVATIALGWHTERRVRR